MCDNLINVGFAHQILTSASSQLGYVNKMILNLNAFKSDILVISYARKYLMTMVDGIGDDEDDDEEEEEEKKKRKKKRRTKEDDRCNDMIFVSAGE